LTHPPPHTHNLSRSSSLSLSLPLFLSSLSDHSQIPLHPSDTTRPSIYLFAPYLLLFVRCAFYYIFWTAIYLLFTRTSSLNRTFIRHIATLNKKTNENQKFHRKCRATQRKCLARKDKKSEFQNLFENLTRERKNPPAPPPLSHP